ncbi:zinc finger and SCAN domain-containing protein 12-like [Nerophis ophidion]|uniref:zinc finger and SCAN domain-containing protein 12-like n=1 Tax=Nerophis ophidion TaxID=159077 RepID=UPI002AE0498E|nr:zinc finger and SCAN domain-containing protein 12-like [Nerophis ophidion]
MCKVEMLRVLVKQRLTAAVEEIFVVLERTIAEYEEELSRRKEENERQRQLLDALFNKHQQTGVSGEHLAPEQPAWGFTVNREETRPPHIKEENLERSEEFSASGVMVKSEEDEVKGESEEKSSSWTRKTTREGDGGGSEADFAPRSDSDETTSHSDDDDEAAHADNSRFKCSFCDKTFYDGSTLKRHARIHTGEKPFVCSVCAQGFTRKDHLMAHTRTHTGERPFSCPLCHASFGFHSALSQHMKIHYGERHTCGQCGKAFRTKSTLTKHLRRHAPDSLFVRGERLARKRNLPGEKSFSCSVCHAAFCYRSGLCKHMQKHA